jgi:hypothetical protein
MPLYTFIHNLLNVLVQIADKMELQNKMKVLHGSLRLAKIVPTDVAIRVVAFYVFECE